MNCFASYTGLHINVLFNPGRETDKERNFALLRGSDVINSFTPDLIGTKVVVGQLFGWCLEIS